MDITVNGLSIIKLVGFLAIYLPVAFAPLAYALFVLNDDDYVNDGEGGWSGRDGFITVCIIWFIVVTVFSLDYFVSITKGG